ncbi:MAG: hypothetical protein HUU45_14010 [Leptospiraceae bacterium]|nr:hypothetical protein [Leptospiraceae bacterium]
MSFSKQEWESYVLGYDIKTCNMRGYCRDKGIPYQSFRYWYKRLLGDLGGNTDQTKLAKPSFLPIRLKNQNLKTSSQGRLRLKLNDVTIVVGADEFNPDLLRQALAVIRSC